MFSAFIYFTRLPGPAARSMPRVCVSYFVSTIYKNKKEHILSVIWLLGNLTFAWANHSRGSLIKKRR